jgi:alpha-D-ribose 1-methylphosphonate 5-triphosphate synthase subunit PhnG
MSQRPDSPDPNARRKDWMSLLAKAPAARLAGLLPEMPAMEYLRPPEVGAVMVRGRVGGTGGAFNLGEMTVTRCSVRIAGAHVGHAYVQGRDKDHATRAAVVDALMQSERADEIGATVLAPLRVDAMVRRLSRAEKAAATKVDFFTMVRGEDQ